MTYLVSIIVPIYNVEAYIEKCLLSISQQTYTKLQVILIDDCGTDQSMSIVEDFCAKYKGDINFRIVRHERNRGLSAARNTGILAASGEYISFIDSDDYIDPHYFEILVSNIRDNLMVVSSPWAIKDNSIYCYNEKWSCNKTFTIPAEKFADYFLLEKVCHTAWGKLARKELYEHIKFRVGVNNEDSLFNLDAINYIEHQKSAICVIPQRLYYYRQRENSICSAPNDEINIQTILNRNEIIERCVQSHRHLVPELQKKQIYGIYEAIFYALETTKCYHYYLWFCRQLKMYDLDSIAQLNNASMLQFSRIFVRTPRLYWLYYHVNMIRYKRQKKIQ